MRGAPRLLLTMMAMTGVAAAQPALPATPVRPPFCLTLDRMIAAAAERRPFASDPNRARVELPGFEHCHVGQRGADGGGVTLWCSRALAPTGLTSERLAADTARCLGAEPVKGEGRAYSFELERVIILIEESCTDACHVGRRVSYGVVAKGRHRQLD